MGETMEVVVDLGSGAIVLYQPEDVARFAVRAVSAENRATDRPSPAALDALTSAIGLHQLGRVDPDGTVFIPPDKVRALARQAATEAGDPLPDAWEAQFSSMLDFAASKGWIDNDGAIAAHIEWSYA
jgi:hypothetical protein